MVSKPTLESLEDRTLLSAGALDPTFGMGGEVVTNFGGEDSAVKVLTQTDGKIVAVGSSMPSFTGHGSNFALARYNADGSLDSSFGVGGRVTSLLGAATSAALQANGDILVAGTNVVLVDGTNVQTFVLARYTPDGALDPTFGTGGSVIASAYGSQRVTLAVQRDGKILLALSRLSTPPSNSYTTIDLFRYNSDGSLDTTFGSAGKVTEAGTGTVFVQGDGKIIIAGNDANIATTVFVTRLNPDGSKDRGFHQLVDLGIGFNALEDALLQADGKIVILGLSNYRQVLVRLNSDGNPDAGFGINGQMLTGFGDHLALQSDGHIIVTGSDGLSMKISRCDPDGSLDSRFGVVGTGVASFPGQAYTLDVTVQADGSIVAAGEVLLGRPGNFSASFALARFAGGPSTPLGGTPNQRFVQQLYLDVMARVADPGGLAFWSGVLDQGLANRTQVAAAFQGSQEYDTLVVQALYHKVLHRAADVSGLTTWTTFLAHGGTAEQLAAILLGSDEYFNLYNPPNRFVNAVYRDVLHRSADGASESWEHAFRMPRQSIAAAILATPESDQDEVEELYHSFLHRAPEAAGLTAFENQLQAGVANEQVMAVLLGSNEYFQLAQQ